MITPAYGDFKPKFYRVFKEEKHLSEFLSGKIRFTKLAYYRDIEDASRRDSQEGIACIKYMGHKRYSTSTDFIYILCFHGSYKSALNSNKGKLIVEISNPKGLASLITKALDNDYYGGVESVCVKYSKNTKQMAMPSNIERGQLVYSQKPKEFKEEEEYRFVLISKKTRESTTEKAYYINLEQPKRKMFKQLKQEIYNRTLDRI